MICRPKFALWLRGPALLAEYFIVALNTPAATSPTGPKNVRRPFMALRPMAEGPVLVGIRPIFRNPLVHAHALELCRSKGSDLSISQRIVLCSETHVHRKLTHATPIPMVY